jgi:asparagine synthase (glutamine-hydrolysing)
MCGICGVLGRADRDVVARMLATIRHRGPDDEFIVSGDGFAMAAARLSIIDVVGGRQPLTNEDGTVTASQNGEIYNFGLLREQLLQRGHVLQTRTDTEVLPHIWEDDGCRLPERIDGMFAVAVWDEKKQAGLLARDRVGKKPLYYWEHDGAVYYASELKALLEVPGFDRRLNLHALHHYLSYKHVPHPLTIFEEVKILPPAHRLLFETGAPPRVERYWQLSFAPRNEPFADEEEVVDELIARLKPAVARRLVSDVPVGFFLSGGIDSSLVTALAAETAGTRIKTFTLTYEDSSTTHGKEQDRRWARWTAERFGTDHREETITCSDYPSAIRRILKAFDEPFAGVVSTYFLAEAMARHVKVAISGDGADELFGSYLSHRMAFAKAHDGDAPDWDWRAKLFVLSEEEKRELYSPAVRDVLADTSTAVHLRRAFDHLTARDPLNRILEAEFGGIFPDQVLTFVDRLSMAHALEVRSPFLDTDVVELVASLPGRLKICNGETKHLLKKAALRYFPEEMIRRPKEGFLMPITAWLLGHLQPWVRETLSPERLRLHGLFDSTHVQRLVDRLREPGADYVAVNRVLVLAIFQEWYELYLA